MVDFSWAAHLLPLMAAGFAVGMLSSAIPYSLEMIGLKRLPAHTFGILMSLEPALAAVSGFLILGELLTPRQLVAIGCVMVASVGSARRAPAAPAAAP